MNLYIILYRRIFGQLMMKTRWKFLPEVYHVT